MSYWMLCKPNVVDWKLYCHFDSQAIITKWPGKIMTAAFPWAGLSHPYSEGSWGQHGAHMGPTGPRWAPCWPHEFCYLGSLWWSWEARPSDQHGVCEPVLSVKQRNVNNLNAEFCPRILNMNLYFLTFVNTYMVEIYFNCFLLKDKELYILKSQ